MLGEDTVCVFFYSPREATFAWYLLTDIIGVKIPPLSPCRVSCSTAQANNWTETWIQSTTPLLLDLYHHFQFYCGKAAKDISFSVFLNHYCLKGNMHEQNEFHTKVRPLSNLYILNFKLFKSFLSVAMLHRSNLSVYSTPCTLTT